MENKAQRKKRRNWQQQRGDGDGGDGDNANDDNDDDDGGVKEGCEFHEHGFLSSGENDYTIVVVPTGSWVFTATGTYDTFSYTY